VLQRHADFARHWYHSEHLLVDGKKMSKSLGNLYTLDDLTAKGHSPMALRYALLSGHPRKQLNFTLDSLHAAEKALGTLRTYRASLPATGGDPGQPVRAVFRRCATTSTRRPRSAPSSRRQPRHCRR
jgi:cysteinyl-tRNA synthetase